MNMRFEDKVLDYEVVQSISLLEEHQLVLYGISSSATRFWPVIKNYNVMAWCDGNADLHGQEFHGYIVESFKNVNERFDLSNIIVIILSVYAEEIMEFCLSISNKVKGFVTIFGLQYCCLINQKKLWLEPEQRESYRKYWKRKLFLEKQKTISSYRYLYNKRILSFQDSDSILIYTVGKVGSSALAFGLEKAGKSALRIEGFSPYLYYIWEEEEIAVYWNLIESVIKEKEKIKIITCVREPVARDISSLMYVLPEQLWGEFLWGDICQVTEDFEKWINKCLVDNMSSLLPSCGYDSAIISNITEATKADVLEKRGKENSIFTFFNLELKEIFGVDVFTTPFNREEGYSIISCGNVECLVLKQEKLWGLESVIRDFTGCSEFKLTEKNSASQRLSGYTYRKLKKNLSIPEEVLDWYYSGKAIRHFYTEEEILKFRDKWQKKRMED